MVKKLCDIKLVDLKWTEFSASAQTDGIEGYRDFFLVGSFDNWLNILDAGEAKAMTLSDWTAIPPLAWTTWWTHIAMHWKVFGFCPLRWKKTPVVAGLHISLALPTGSSSLLVTLAIIEEEKTTKERSLRLVTLETFYQSDKGDMTKKNIIMSTSVDCKIVSVKGGQANADKGWRRGEGGQANDGNWLRWGRGSRNAQFWLT